MRWRLVVTNTRQDIKPLTTFKRNSSELMKRMKKTRRPLVLTVQGKAKAVLLDTASYRDMACYLESVAAITEGSVKNMGIKVNDAVTVAIKATEMMIGK